VLLICAEKRTSAELFVSAHGKFIWCGVVEYACSVRGHLFCTIVNNLALSMLLLTSCVWCEYAPLARGIEPFAFSVCLYCTIPCAPRGYLRGAPLNCSLARFCQHRNEQKNLRISLWGYPSIPLRLRSTLNVNPVAYPLWVCVNMAFHAVQTYCRHVAKCTIVHICH